MNILYFCEVYHGKPYGPSTHGREFFAALRQQTDIGRCKVIPTSENSSDVSRRSPDTEQVDLIRLLIRRLSKKWLREFVRLFFPQKSAYKLIRNELTSRNWDVLVMRPELSLALVPKLKKQFPHVCITLEINAAIFEELYRNFPFSTFWKSLEVRMMNSADVLLCVSHNLKDYLMNFGADPERIHVNPNGVNPSKFNPELFSDTDRKAMRAELNIPEKALVFGYVGGMQTFRHLPDMVKVFSSFLAESHAYSWMILIGDGEDMPEIRKIYRQLPHEHQKRIILAGAKPYASIPRIMSVFDVGVFPYSNSYGSPQKLFEYMAMGLPVIGPKVPVVEELFQHNQHLFLTAQVSYSDLKRHLLYCAQNFPSLAGMAEKGREYVTENYTWDANAQRAVNRIQDWLNENKRKFCLGRDNEKTGY